MAEAQARAHPGAPWAVRLYGAVPLAPAWTGALIAAAWLLAFVGYALAADLTAVEVDAGVQIFFELVCAVMIGFLPTATVYGVRGTARDLRALGPALGLSAAQLEERVRELVRFDARPLVSAGIIGAAAAFCLGIASADSPSAWPEGRPALGAAP